MKSTFRSERLYSQRVPVGGFFAHVRRNTVIILSLLIFGGVAAAQDAQPEASSPATDTNNPHLGILDVPYIGSFPGMEAAGTRPVFGAGASYSYVSSGGISYAGLKGNSDADAISASVVGEIPINEKWFVPAGIRSENLFLGTVAGAPIPDQIDTLGLNLGLGYHINDQWTVAASLGPVLYRFDNFSGNDIGVGGMIRATYILSPTLAFVMGLGFEPDSDLPVLPLAGLCWRINTNLTLNLMFPRTELVYRVAPRLNVSAGLSGEFAVFRTSEDLGNKIGQSQYNNALGTYHDFHVGGGAEYRICSGLSIRVEGGYSFAREIRYKDIGQTVSFDPGPFVQAGFRCRF